MRCCLTRYDNVENEGNGPDPMIDTTHALLTAYIFSTDQDRSQHPDMKFRQCDRTLSAEKNGEWKNTIKRLFPWNLLF
jgi:hypothetical protein